MVLPQDFKLSQGSTIPAIGLGTWQSKKGEVGKAVKIALASGYRHLDCAWVYQNEAEIGAAIRKSGVPRNEIFLTSKLWNGFHRPDHVEVSVDVTLKSLGTEYLDMYLMHWPVAFGVADGKPRGFPKGKDGKVMIDRELTHSFMETWRAMEALVDKGKVKVIGVSNFSIGRCKHLLHHCRIKPVANQVEVNWSWPQHELFDWCNANGIVMQAYSPLGSNKSAEYLSNPVIKAIAQENGAEPAQIILGWLLKRGMVVLAKSVTPSRIQSNLRPFDLPEAKFEALQALSRALKNPARTNNPSKFWGVEIFDDSPYAKL